jgi:hypothetical protein
MSSLCTFGHVVAEGAAFIGRSSVRGGNFYGLSATTGTPAVRADGRVAVSFLGINNNPVCLISSVSTKSAVLASRGAEVTFERAAITATGTGSAAVMSETGGSWRVTSTSNVSGSGESFGLRARRGGRGFLTVASTALTYTGAAADTRGALAVGEAPSIAGGTCLNLGTGLGADGAVLAVATGDGSAIQRAA